MSQLPATFRGRFQLWSYSVSHGQLLLRSTKSTERSTQIDVLFTNVAAICLPAAFDNLEIRKSADDDCLSSINLGALSFSERDLYLICGGEENGYVVAGSVIWQEDDREYDAISLLLLR